MPSTLRRESPCLQGYEALRGEGWLGTGAFAEGHRAATMVTEAAMECPEGNDAPLVATSDPGGLARS